MVKKRVASALKVGQHVRVVADIRVDREVLARAGNEGVVTRAPTRADPTAGVMLEGGRRLWVRPAEIQVVAARATLVRGSKATRRAGARRSARRKRARPAVSRQWTFPDGRVFYTAAGAQRHRAATGLRPRVEARR
jgi:hypothetical protein